MNNEKRIDYKQLLKTKEQIEQLNDYDFNAYFDDIFNFYFENHTQTERDISISHSHDRALRQPYLLSMQNKILNNGCNINLIALDTIQIEHLLSLLSANDYNDFRDATGSDEMAQFLTTINDTIKKILNKTIRG